MKKNIKKFAGMMLALVMTFALAAPAFAAEPKTAAADTVTVTFDITAYGESLLGETPTVTVAKGSSVYDALIALNDDHSEYKLNPQWADRNSLLSTEQGQQLMSLQDIAQEPVGKDSGETAEYWSSSMPGYGLVNTTVVDGKTLYHYIYVGNAWKYTVNGKAPVSDKTDSEGNPIEFYMNEYKLNANSTVEIDYNQYTETWSSTDYLFKGES